MNLDEAQKQQVVTWIEQGQKLSEIQSRLASEFGVRMTYMEVRFLMDDLKLKPKDKEAPPPPATAAPTSPTPADKGPQPELPAEDDLGEGDEGTGKPGGVSVTVDQLARPGALVSGKVTFSDGNTADWYLDQMGRLGLAPKQQGYRPPQSDLMAFQAELQSALARMGF